MPRVSQDPQEAIEAGERITSLVRIWEPKTIPIVSGGKQTIGQCIDEILQRSDAVKLELNLDPSTF